MIKAIVEEWWSRLLPPKRRKPAVFFFRSATRISSNVRKPAFGRCSARLDVNPVLSSDGLSPRSRRCHPQSINEEVNRHAIDRNGLVDPVGGIVQRSLDADFHEASRQ